MAPIKYKPIEMDGFEKDERPGSRYMKRRSPPKFVWAAVILFGTLFLAWGWNDAGKRLGEHEEHGGLYQNPKVAYKAPKKNVWADLDEDEFEDVLTYLYSVPNDLNLTRTGEAGP
jgi:hypothetical protein